MVKRCDHCIYFLPTVFDQETQSGYGCWNGYCLVQPSKKHGWLSNKRVKNMYYACEDYFTEIPRLKRIKWKWLCWWNFIDLLEFLRVDLMILNIPLNFSAKQQLSWRI